MECLHFNSPPLTVSVDLAGKKMLALGEDSCEGKGREIDEQEIIQIILVSINQ